MLRLSAPAARTVALACLWAALLGPGTAAQFPTGVAEDILVSAGLERPVGLAFLPDGRILLIEHRSGHVKVYARGTVATIGTVTKLAQGGEDGLLGIAVDPAWPASPYVYLYSTQEEPATGVRDNRIARYTAVGDLSDPASANLTLTARREVLTGIAALNDLHNGGTLRFGPDGMLYASIGDGGVRCNAQDLTDLHGKILRLDVSGVPAGSGGPPPRSSLAPADNPFAGPGDEARLVFCYGLRNPFRFTIDPLTNRLAIGDVGENTWEELNVVTGGENLGWPWFEGPMAFDTCPGGMPANLTLPVWLGYHDAIPENAAVMPLGGIYRNQPNGVLNLGPAYEGNLIFANIGTVGAVYHLAFDGATWDYAPQVPGQIFTTVWGGVAFPVDGQVGPDGAIYYLQHLPSSLRRVKNLATAPLLLPVSGLIQSGNAGYTNLQQIAVRLLDPTGVPIQGAQVDFGIIRGGGSLAPSPPTDATGSTTVSYTLASTWPGVDPIVTATWGGSNVVNFNIDWRGLVLTQSPLTTPGTLGLQIRHSAAAAPLIIASQLQAPAVPFAATPFGPLWTSVAAPTPGLVVAVDGFGYFPGIPSATTDVSGLYSVTYRGIPPGIGVSFVTQAYALDANALTPGEEVLVSNPVTITLP